MSREYNQKRWVDAIGHFEWHVSSYLVRHDFEGSYADFQRAEVLAEMYNPIAVCMISRYDWLTAERVKRRILS